MSVSEGSVGVLRRRLARALSIGVAAALLATTAVSEAMDPAVAVDSAPSGEQQVDTAPGEDPMPTIPVDPAPEEVRSPSADELGSDSPGPDTAKPWMGEQAGAPGTLQSTAAGRGAVLGNDYPAKYRKLPWPYPAGQSIWDEWNFAYRQCTSFVAWRLNSANRVGFSNQYKGLARWGDAGQWKASAQSVGIRVDKTPEVGAVAWSGPNYRGASAYGHVAWVARVLNNGDVVVEEYNAGWAGWYGTRTVKASDFQGYIHISDLTKSFTTTTTPTVGGAAMVGGTLSASLAQWSPQATTVSYRWYRDGAPIAGATKRTYQPTLADLGATLTVEATGDRKGYRAESLSSAGVPVALMTDANGDGIADAQQLLPWNSDVNGDGRPDVVGFSQTGVQVALSTDAGIAPAEQWAAGFGAAAGWTAYNHPRTLADMNGDGRSDVVGFHSGGVYVALSTGSGFASPTRWVAGFGSSQGWVGTAHLRTLADANGDGRLDVIGFKDDGVYVALNSGKSSLGKATLWSAAFGAAGSWSIDRHPRWIADVNADGLADVVAIASGGVRVALSTGKSFSGSKSWSSDFGYAKGWRVSATPRALADVDGDGLPDVVGFASDGVYVSTGTGSGLRGMKRWSSDFGVSKGWLVGRNPRTLADVNGDGRADIVGFGGEGAYVALSSGSGFGAAQKWSDDFKASSWRADRHPRFATDADGDGRADIVGISDSGVKVAISTGRGFGAAQPLLADMGRNAGWQVATMPRAFGVPPVLAPVPKLSGAPRLGETLTASTGKWSPASMQLSYQWLRDGRAIPGQQAKSYRLAKADLGARISLSVQGAGAGQPTTVRRSAATVAVVIGPIQAATPRISGTAKVGRTLQARAGAWKPGKATLSYRWYRDDKRIGGAAKPSYKLKAKDRGKRITVRVTGERTHYISATRVSKPTAKIRR